VWLTGEATWAYAFLGCWDQALEEGKEALRVADLNRNSRYSLPDHPIIIAFLSGIVQSFANAILPYS